MHNRTRRTSALLVVMSLSLGGAMQLTAQMDMMPEIFRDLPPEMQDGLPANMSYREYRQMTRNVDFFTMFMSMWVPGYGMFQVERPAIGWTIAGVRAAGYGLMGAAMYRQWNDIKNLSVPNSLEDLPVTDVLVNSALFAGGIIVNGLGWAGDIVGAYHTAKTEKDFVLYSYGIRTEQSSGAERAGEQQQDIAYIRQLLFQDLADEPQVRQELMRALEQYQQRYPRGEYRAEVAHYIGTRRAEQGQPIEALAALVRQIRFHPDQRYSPLSRQRAASLVQEHRHAWSQDRETLLEMIAVEPEHASQDSGEQQRSLGYLQGLAELDNPEFIELSIREARAIARQYPADDVGAAALLIAGQQAERLGQREEAVRLYTGLAASRPASAEAPQAMMRVARLLDELDEPGYAQRFYSRLIDTYPDSAQAEAAAAN